MPFDWVVVGLDNGGTTNNGTILDSEGRFLLDQMAEVPSNVREGPDKAIQSLIDAVEQVLALAGVPLAAVRAIGLDTPGPASADGVISSKGATNFGDAGWGGFDIRGALAERVGLPVIYNNDGNAAALYAHHVRFGAAVGAAQLGVRDRGHRARRRPGRGRAGDQGRGRDGRGARPCPDPAGRPAGPGSADARLQLRAVRRRGERGLAHRDHEEPAALLAHQVPRPPGRQPAPGPGGQADAALWRAGRRPGPGHLPSAGHRPGAAVHHRRELLRSRRLLPGRRRGGGRAALPRLVPDRGPGQHRAARGAIPGRGNRLGARPRHGRRPRVRHRGA